VPGQRPLDPGAATVATAMPMGDAIDRAARTLARRASSPSQPPAESAGLIAIDRVTAALLDARFEVKATDAGLYLVAARELAEGARTLLGKPTACVGRDWELGALQQIWSECVEEPVARAVLVTAAAGMGKSRVAHELMRAVRQRSDAAIWIGRGDAIRASSAFGLLGQALRGACGSGRASRSGCGRTSCAPGWPSGSRRARRAGWRSSWGRSWGRRCPTRTARSSGRRGRTPG